jgi:hypothetical protein
LTFIGHAQYFLNLAGSVHRHDFRRVAVDVNEHPNEKRHGGVVALDPRLEHLAAGTNRQPLTWFPQNPGDESLADATPPHFLSRVSGEHVPQQRLRSATPIVHRRLTEYRTDGFT